MNEIEREAVARLREIPNVGPKMAADLLKLGVRRLEDAAGRDPDEMYNELCALDARRHDPACATSSPPWSPSPKAARRGPGGSSPHRGRPAKRTSAERRNASANVEIGKGAGRRGHEVRIRHSLR